MEEKAGVAHPYLIICELCELCEQMPSVYFLRKVSMFLGKLRTRKGMALRAVPVALRAFQRRRRSICASCVPVVGGGG